ncbi:DUF4773 domain-containing protein [Caerostris extrusa]|uniref:DUF4773 domain-containing protein n=1 Tax=Caerostris extrusa TaxID=172846 RepID=A0AAV4MSJ5_CAEEX|nr:DUF4773 domain-containing protein [Caerostris extrusa]
MAVKAPARHEASGFVHFVPLPSRNGKLEFCKSEEFHSELSLLCGALTSGSLLVICWFMDIMVVRIFFVLLLFSTGDATALRRPDDSCACADFECECCAYLRIPEIGLNHEGEEEIKEMKEEIKELLHASRVSARKLRNSTVFHNQQQNSSKYFDISEAPPPLCVSVPFLKQFGYLCLELHTVDVSGSRFAACARVDVAVWPFCASRFELGCFDTTGPPSPPHKDTEAVKYTNYDISQDPTFPWQVKVCSGAGRSSQVALGLAAFLAILHSVKKSHDIGSC